MRIDRERGEAVLHWLLRRRRGWTAMISGPLLASGSLWAASDLFGIPIEVLTPSGLLGLLILLIAVGLLVPRRTMNDVIKDRDEWRQAHRLSEEARVTQAQAVHELLEYARTADAILRSLPHPNDRSIGITDG